MTIDEKQARQIGALVGLFSILTAVVTVAIYFEQKRHSNLKNEIMALDKNIKELQLQKLKNTN